MEIIPVSVMNLGNTDIECSPRNDIEEMALDVLPVPTLLPSTGYALLSLWMFIITVISVFSNSMVIAVMLKKCKLFLPANILILSLAISDLLMTLSGSAIGTVTNYYGQFFMGRQLCIFQGFMVNYFGLVSLCTLTFMAYERYRIVCNAMGVFKITTRRSAKGLLLVWLYCLFWSVVPLLGWGSYGPEGVQTSCSLAWEERTWISYSYLIPYWFFCFLLPTGIIIHCYYHILHSMRRLNMSVENQGGKSRQKDDRQITCMVAGMIGSFFFCWMPYAAISMLVVFMPDLPIAPLLASLPAYLAKTSPVYNPIIFFLAKKQFRDEALKIVLCCCFGRTPTTVTSASDNTAPNLNSIKPEP